MSGVSCRPVLHGGEITFTVHTAHRNGARNGSKRAHAGIELTKLINKTFSSFTRNYVNWLTEKQVEVAGAIEP